MSEMRLPRNVLGGPLAPCSSNPLTGFYRNGCCDTGSDDYGQHTVCVITSPEFLEFSRLVGNDLSTPAPHFDFPGLRPGDQWCLCVQRWVQAYEAGIAPQVVLEASHEAALEFVELDVLRRYAATPRT